MRRAQENEAADGRRADSYSQCAGGRGRVSPCAKELDLVSGKCGSLMAVVIHIKMKGTNPKWHI